MKRLMLAVVALFSFTAITFAQAKPTQKSKPKTESTTKKAATDSTHKKTTASKKAPAKTTATKKS
jgi:Ni/Co efflux regulator RcnB